MKTGLPKGPVLVMAAVILAIGLGVIVSSFFREVLPEFAGDMEPLLRAGVVLFFIGAAYFLTALVLLLSLRPTPTGEGEANGADTEIAFRLRDSATHVASSILILVGAAVLLTVSLTRPGDEPPGDLVGTGPHRMSEEHERLDAEDHQSADPLVYYASQGIVTDPRPHADLFEGLPEGVDALVTSVQGLLLHVFWAEAHGVNLTEERHGEPGIRSVGDMLARIRELDGRPLSNPRDVERKLVGNCRDYSVLLTAMLRHQGIPARARSGFGTYFTPGEYTDHWVCEYWNADEVRWVTVDAQLDELQISTLGITFDPLDVPPGRFVTGGEAWLTCRAGDADPKRFGIMDLRGMSFIRGNVGHDVWALNKIETLPWEGWGVPWKEESDLTRDDLDFLDEVSRLTLRGDESFGEIRSLCDCDERLSKPRGWPTD